RGGRPDLAMEFLPRVKAPSLLIVGESDDQVIDLNRLAFDQLKCKKELVIVPGATHLFEEPGALEQVAELSARWFSRYLTQGP
ncbi:MAG: alpha/beta hydrolase, partial [Nitrospiria bacterium]